MRRLAPIAIALLAAAPAWAQTPAPKPSAVPPILPLVLQAQPSVPPAADDGAAGDVLTLDEAVAMATSQNRSVKNSNLSVGMAGDQVDAAKAQRWPQLQVKATPGARLTPIDLNFDKGSFGTFAATGPIPANDVTLSTGPGFTASLEASVAQPLAQLYALNLTVDQLGVSRDMSRQDLRTQRQSVVNSVRQQYFTVLQSQSSLESLGEQVASNRELVRVLSEQAAQQTVLPSTLSQAKVALAQTEYTIRSTRHTLQSQKEQLNFYLGRDPQTPFRVVTAPSTQPLPLDLAAAQGAAIRQRPDLLKARLQAIYQDYAVRLGRAAYIPDVSFVVKYLSPVTADQLPKNIAYAGIQISWDVWDWGKKAANLEQSKRAREQAKNAAEDAAAQVVLDVNSAFRKLEDAQAFVGVSEQNREYAREALRETTNQFRQQTALPKDVLAAQATLGQASDQYRQAVLSYWEARASFDKALGVDQ